MREFNFTRSHIYHSTASHREPEVKWNRTDPKESVMASYMCFIVLSSFFAAHFSGLVANAKNGMGINSEQIRRQDSVKRTAAETLFAWLMKTTYSAFRVAQLGKPRQANISNHH